MAEKSHDVLDRQEVTSVLFHPRHQPPSPRLEKNQRTVRIPVGDDNHLGGKLFIAEVESPVIIFFHGNGEIAADYDTIAPVYESLGLSLFIIDYRGYGDSSGVPSASALIDDAYPAFEGAMSVLAENELKPRAFYMMGRSLGSAPALEVVSRAGDKLAGLILESGFAHTLALIERIGFVQVADAFEQRDGFGNIDKIAKASLPTLIIHGERDVIIPIGDAETLFEASPATDKQFVRVPGAGHNDLMMVGYREYFGAIAKFCGTLGAA
jgi:fermentation-respiration switch protein FrsA (DUF1100 family)